MSVLRLLLFTTVLVVLPSMLRLSASMSRERSSRACTLLVRSVEEFTVEIVLLVALFSIASSSVEELVNSPIKYF